MEKGDLFMKKSVVVFLVVIIFIILLGILCFKIYQSNTKYSSEDIYALVQKGIENMHDMQNICIEIKNESEVIKYYYKGNKKKTLVEDGNSNSVVSYNIVDLDKKKDYIVSDKNKFVLIQKVDNFNKGLQYDVLDAIDYENGNIKIELSYIKDEKINGKDCVFVKEVTYYKTDDGSFQTYNQPDENIRAYWIEKTTGFVLGATMIKPTQENATPQVWINNIIFNEVVDSDFDLPNNYTIYDKSE